MLHDQNNLSKTQIDEFLNAQRIGTLSLTDGERAYGIPLAYSYDGESIYLSILPKGRKIDYLNKNTNVSFSVFWMPDGTGAQGFGWVSVILDGQLEHLAEPGDIAKAVRIAERKMNLPEGTWDRLIDKAVANPEKSMFWKLKITSIGARAR